MKIGKVIAQERRRKNLTVAQAASAIGLSVADYQVLEGGKNTDLENAANLLLQFNELIEGQVNQIFYPCGLPFTSVNSYQVS